MQAERKVSNGRALVIVVVAAVTASAFVVAGASVQRWGAPNWGEAAFFWALHALTLLDRIEVPVDRLTLARPGESRGVVLSPGFVVLLTAAFATSPSTAVVVALVPCVSVLADRDGRRPLKLIFNASQEAVYVGLAGATFTALTGASDNVAVLFGAAALASIVALSVNTLLVVSVVAADRGASWSEIARRMTWTIPHSIAFGLVALMIATVFDHSGAAAALFLFFPLAALRVTRRAKVELDKAREATITDFVRAVEAKDPYTFRHSERVATIAVELHRSLGAKASDLERRWIAGLLHDVGKIAVPAEILAKTGPLTAEEFEAIKAHPTIGAEAVRTIDLFLDLVPEVQFHHERMDGTGYPDGLSGLEIPHEARVLAVADAFEALTSERPYRAALTVPAALAELERTAGQHHDPEIVATLRAVLDSGVTFARGSGAPAAAQGFVPQAADG